MRRIAYLIAVYIMIFAVIGSAASCASSPSPVLDENTVRVYADPATDTTLQGLSENNLAKYTQYGNTKFKEAITQKILDATSAQINSQLGTYQSKEYLKAQEQQGYIVVHYKVKYSKGDVGIRMVFDNDHLVAGQWFE